jgi:hypothetical protein
LPHSGQVKAVAEAAPPLSVRRAVVAVFADERLLVVVFLDVLFDLARGMRTPL